MKLIRNGDANEVFWAEIAPCDHLVQFYESERIFLDSLEAFVAGGLRCDESVILIATPDHLRALDLRLKAARVDLALAEKQDRYIRLDAESTLERFMVDGWPDEGRFNALVSGLLKRGMAGGARVRAFGEMVAILWQKKLYAATVRLEHLWHRYCSEAGFSLLCAYPQSGVTRPVAESMQKICEAHTHVITAHGLAPH